MKYLLIGTAVMALGLGAAWYGGETWLSRKAAEVVEADPRIAATEIAPLRDPGRIGLHLAGIEVRDAAYGLTAPELEAYVPLSAPTRLTLGLPPRIELLLDGTPISLSMTDGQAHVALAPLQHLAVRRAGITARAVGVDGVEMLQSLDVDARLTHMGARVPPGSRAAYTITITAEGLALGGLQERLNISGPMQLWLTGLPDQPVLAGRVPPPALTGLQTPGLRFALGGIEARLIGRVQADAEGFAEGETAIYTADAAGFIEAAVTAGLIPQEAARLVKALVQNLPAAPAKAETPAQPAGAQLPNLNAVDAAEASLVADLPPAPPGQIRLPLTLKNGRILLGPIPIGPAPRLVADAP